MAAAGFTESPEIITVPARSRAESPEIPAIAFCQGTPLRNEIETRDASRVDEATRVAAAELAQRFGGVSLDGKIQAHIVSIRK